MNNWGYVMPVCIYQVGHFGFLGHLCIVDPLGTRKSDTLLDIVGVDGILVCLLPAITKSLQKPSACPSVQKVHPSMVEDEDSYRFQSKSLVPVAV